ncbi:unnamed protein product [Linum trigynum]|uniref:Bifunctional inhibitor/plant lipid transfer protein/seed storage helical domain-containing protein n=1 Tax=Linum trigynum TaxID=586398 RepID=A0AAV2EYB6_9ROSI
MASLRTHCGMALAVVVTILAVLGHGGSKFVAMADLDDEPCKSDLPGLKAACFDFIKFEGPAIPPSEECCKLIRSADSNCTCNFVTPEAEKMVDMKKVVYVGRSCGLHIPAGFKCGSYIAPPPLTVARDRRNIKRGRKVAITSQ